MNLDPTSTWILIANRAGARIFVNYGPGKGLKFVASLDHPEGRLRDQEAVSDKPGRGFSSASGGPRHALVSEQDYKEHEVEKFAKLLAKRLDDGRNQNEFEQLILAADPKFLGKIKGALNSQTAGKVVATLGKDLWDVADRDIPEHLRELIRV